MSNSKLLSDDAQSPPKDKGSNNVYVAFETPPSPKFPKSTSQRFGLSKSPPVESTLGNNNKYEPLSSNRERSYSIDSMTDGKRRKNKNARKDPDYFRFPQPKTLLFEKSNIGLYSPLVSTRRSALTQSLRNRNNNNNTSTIYDGVPSYLNPRLMKQRENRSKSVKSREDSTNDDDDNDDSNQTSAPFTRSQSERTTSPPADIMYEQNSASINKETDLGDYPLMDIKRAKSTKNDDKNNKHRRNKSNYLRKELLRSHAQTVPNRDEAFSRRGSYSYQDLEGDPNRDRLRTEWRLFNDEHGLDFPNPARKLTQQELNVSYVKTAPQKRLLEDFSTIWKRAYFALIVLALFNGLLTFGISKVASYVWQLEQIIYESDTFEVAHGAPAYLLIVLLKVVLVLMAIYLVRTFAPGCAGSGVPELRAILSGIWIRHYLSRTTFVVKILALTCSLSSGVPIGLEGPFIHLSSIMARQLTKLKVFAHLDRKQMLSAACAGGLASVFGAPIGGVLFSIEVTSTYYPVTNYWTAFCCAMVGSTMAHVLQDLSPTSILLYQNNFSDADPPQSKELGFFLILGLLMGLAGVGFIYFHDVYVDLRRRYQSRFLGDNPYGIAIVVIVFFTTILFFIGDFAIEPARKAVADMFNIEFLDNCDYGVFGGEENFSDEKCDFTVDQQEYIDNYCGDSNDEDICKHYDNCHCHYHDWIINPGGLYGNLFAVYILNYFFTICAVTLSFPCGIFSPIFTLGSVAGRIYGEIFRGWFAFCDPRVYSVVGAAAMAAGVTQTISPAVIALEVTQDLSLAVPCLLAVIMSGGVSGSLIHSFYDSVLQLRGIPMLPIRPTVAYKRIFIKPKRRKKAHTLPATLSLLSTNKSKSKENNLPNNNTNLARQNSDSFSESDIDYNLDQGRLSVDSKPEIFDAANGRSKNDHIMVLNRSMKRGDKANEKKYDSSMKAEAMYRLLIADDVMYKEFSFVTIDPSAKELVGILTKDIDQEWFPIVHTISEAVLVGEARRSVLMDLLKAMDRQIYNEEIPAELRMSHTSFYDQSSTQIKDKASLMNDTSLVTETLNRTTRSQTFREKMTNKLRKKSYQTKSKESIEMDEKEDDNNKDNENEIMSNKDIKLTLMTSGFIERINLSPIQVISEMPLTKIYTLFHILKPQNVYVTKYSRLIGVINEVQLLQREFETQRTSKKARLYCLRCKRICANCEQLICGNCCC